MRYLLGTLSEAEEIRLEDAFFEDDANFEELEVAEDDLIDAYVRKELSVGDERQFQARLLSSPRIAKRVNFARALAAKTSAPGPQSQEAVQPGSFNEPAPKSKVRWWEEFFGFGQKPRLALAAGVVLILVGGVALLMGWLQLRGESARLAAERAAVQRQKEELEKKSTEQQAKSEQLTAEIQRDRDQLAEERRLLEERQRGAERSPSILATIASVVLTPSGSRSPGAGSDLKFGPNISSAQLTLALRRNEYDSYNVSIKTADDAVVVSRKGLKPRKTGSVPALILSVPAKRLPPKNYIASVDGVTASGQIESVADYSFRVLKSPK